MRKREIVLILALFIASLNLRPAITSVSPLLGAIRDGLGMSGASASLLTSIPVLCMGLFAPGAVKLSNRWGIERTIACAMLLIGAATIARLFVSSTLFLLFTAFCAGIGISVAGPLLSGFIKRHFPNAGAMVGVYSMAMVVGAALSSGLSVPLEDIMKGSWRGSLASWTALAVIALPLWWHLARRENRVQVSAITSARGRPPAPVQTRIPWRDKRAWLLTLFFGVVATLFYSITAWLAPAAESMGYDQASAGGVLTLFSLTQIPISLLLPLLISRWPKRLFWLLLCSGFELAGILLIVLSANPWIAAVPLGIGAGGLFPIVLMLPIDETPNAEAAGAWSALTLFGGYIIGSFGPLLVGWIHDLSGSFTEAFAGLAVLVGIMMIIQLMIGNKKEASGGIQGQRETVV
ncbi:MFS transporter [Paenibacillus sp. sptzw28]|uniref:MFS transporter n=1 Tax=Paenibacillus sp. sptzw28 TaxID=715179 RepID=UPI001C6E490C|nr:MFS transporter [Paenibacillus sp. sptzw28]QYR21845.1 MFS transporter [Paenibacillus sp. sptzw28]